MKNILIIGSGGREHALAWKVAQSPKVQHIYVAPGNAGTAQEANTTNVAIDVMAIDKLITFAKDKAIDLTIVGPEAPLAAGIVDQFQQAGLTCFGPSQKAAQLEASKSFSKAFMQRHGIPTAHYQTFTDKEKAKAYIRTQGTPIVIKADGLAAGKGVVIAQSQTQACQAVDKLLTDANSSLVIEEFLTGEEASFIVMADGQHGLAFATSQDHKSRDVGDKGPNTGGMGAYSPAPVVTKAIHQRILEQVITPTIKGMAQEGHAYVGFLYAGLMIDTKGQPKVLEFNCRFGDPETQPILLRLQSDIVELCAAALAGQLHQATIQWDPRAALGVVMCAGGYPEKYRKGDVIKGLDKVTASNVKVFHAGTQVKDNHLVTHGGRVLCVTALGDSVALAQQKAYAAVKHITWADCYYRSDIGYRAIARETQQTSASKTTATHPTAKVVFTEAAATKVAELMQDEGNYALMLRVYITGGGCSGFQYGFSFTEKLEDDDLLLDKKVNLPSDSKTKPVKVTLLVDPLSYQYLTAAEIDYKKDVQGERFVIRNPNAQTTCGCGSSFSPA